MLKSIKSVLKISLLALAGTFVFTSCEADADDLGSQFFDGAEGNVQTYDVIAYNVNNNDTIRTDKAKIPTATLGAFTESKFGMQRSAFVSQVRLTNYAPDFGANAVVDSVVLIMKPLYPADSVTTSTDENFPYPDAATVSKKVVNTYPVTKYGKTKSSLTINVHEVTDFLGSSTDIVYSDKQVNTGQLLGSKIFNGTINSVKITKKSDNSDLLTRDASLRINLDKDFFQNKIIAKKGSAELSDVSNFIRYFKGLKISVAEKDGYFFYFQPSNISMVMYYKYDATSNATTTRTQNTMTFDFGTNNVQFSQIEHDRTGSAVASATYDAVNGDAKLYAQGMGGPGFGIKIPAATVAQIKDLYKKQNIGILSAKIKLFTDTAQWNNSFPKPSYFTVKQKDSTGFTADVKALGGSANFNLVKSYNLNQNPAYYEITITQTFKNLIEKEASNTDIIMNVGSYLASDSGIYIGQNSNTRAFAPHRVVLVGTESGNANRAQLNIIYTKK